MEAFDVAVMAAVIGSALGGLWWLNWSPAAKRHEAEEAAAWGRAIGGLIVAAVKAEVARR